MGRRERRARLHEGADTQQINTARVFAALVVLGVCGIAFFAFVGLLQRMFMPWVYGRPHLRWLPWRRAPAVAAIDAKGAGSGTR